MTTPLTPDELDELEREIAAEITPEAFEHRMVAWDVSRKEVEDGDKGSGPRDRIEGWFSADNDLLDRALKAIRQSRLHSAGGVEGWVMVPVEPTNTMTLAICNDAPLDYDDAKAIWLAALAAAPASPAPVAAGWRLERADAELMPWWTNT